MASDSTFWRLCDHPVDALRGPCPFCLEATRTRADLARARALHLQFDARRILERARVARENRLLRRSSENTLPPADYVLSALPHAPPFAADLPPLSFSESNSEADRWRSPPPQPGRTTVYAWGCGRPRAPLTRWQIRYTEEAARYATERGWDEDGWAAWAVEATLPIPLSQAIGKFGSRLSRDPAVRGWGMRSLDED